MKKCISMILVIVMVAALLPMQAFASDDMLIAQRQQRSLGLADIGSGGYQRMQASQMVIDVLKVTEGYTQKAYADNTQYSIGYGTKSYASEVLPDGKAGYEEAERRLKNEVAYFEKFVNNFMVNTLEKQPSQNQFDALVCFTYNVGTSWFFGSNLASWLKNPTTEIDFLNAFGQWCHVDTTPWYGLAQRRIREALIFLKGEYYLPSKPGPEHLIHSPEFQNDVIRYVRPNGSLPYFASIIMEFDESISGDRIEYRQYGDVLGNLPVPKAKGQTFTGWILTEENNASVSPRAVSSSTEVTKNVTLKARWDNSTDFVPPSSTGVPFGDIYADDWYCDEVKFVYDRGFMAGISDDEFAPKDTMSRGMLVSVLYRIAGRPDIPEEQLKSFDDVDLDSYYTVPIAWAKQNGVVMGVDDTHFEPDAKVSRQDAAAIFARFCVDYLNVSSFQSADLSRFADEDEVSNYAQKGMQWAVAVGMLEGSDEDEGLVLRPQSSLDRAEGAALLMRCVKKFVD